MADSLLKLTILKVKGASQLAEVFTNEDKGDIVVQKDVRLPQICKIALKGLPSLVNFCPRNYHAILPKLYCLKVQRCPNMTTKFTRTPDKSVHINGEVPQVDEEDEPTGFSTNSSVVTLWPPNKDEGDVDNDDLEWDDADLMGRRKVTYRFRRG
uniref:Uncharacterized protein n=1 Tax=Fagus sylvatica TaxID=28930 RepID=A0A2N9FGS7_FAGSY